MSERKLIDQIEIKGENNFLKELLPKEFKNETQSETIYFFYLLLKSSNQYSNGIIPLETKDTFLLQTFESQIQITISNKEFEKTKFLLSSFIQQLEIFKRQYELLVNEELLKTLKLIKSISIFSNEFDVISKWIIANFHSSVKNLNTFNLFENFFPENQIEVISAFNKLNSDNTYFSFLFLFLFPLLLYSLLLFIHSFIIFKINIFYFIFIVQK